MRYVLGIDGGGTKTVCVLMDETAQIQGRGETGAANYQTVGIHVALNSIQSAIHAALKSHTTKIKIEAICFGLAGVGRSADIQIVNNLVQELTTNHSLPITWALQPPNIVISHDALIALVGGIGYPVGIVAIAGTGSIIFGQNRQGRTQRVGGWGPILGDEGSAYQIAVQGLKASLRAYDRRSEPTSLQARFIEHLGLQSIESLIEVVYQRGWGVKEIAALAPIVDQAAASGDVVATTIIDTAVQELVKATSVVIDDLFSPAEAFKVVTAGSVWCGNSQVRDKFASDVIRHAPSAEVIFPQYEPAYGAGLLALDTFSRII